MFSYIGTECPYCGKPFTERDDIAVCPECGTPHHRSCYREHGACANAARHADGFVWQAPEAPRAAPRAAQPEAAPQPEPVQRTDEEYTVCRSCGTRNARTDRYCKNCGATLERMPQMPGYRPAAPRPAVPPVPGAAPYSTIGALNADDRIDGIPVRDWIIYIGGSAVPYLRSFQQQDRTGSKAGFTIGALLAPVLFFLYRKVWKAAALLSAISVVLNFPSLLLDSGFVGAGGLWGLSYGGWQTLGEVGSWLYIGVCVVCAIFAMTIYRRDAGEKIRRMRRACTNEQEYMQLLTRNAGPSGIALALVLVLVALSFLSVFALL